MATRCQCNYSVKLLPQTRAQQLEMYSQSSFTEHSGNRGAGPVPAVPKPNKLQNITIVFSPCFFQMFQIRKVSQRKSSVRQTQQQMWLLVEAGRCFLPLQTLTRQRLLSNCCAVVSYLYTMAGWCVSAHRAFSSNHFITLLYVTELVWSCLWCNINMFVKACLQ